jgi:hypothetical protein
MTQAQDPDRIVTAWLTGIARRHASRMLASTGGDERAAITELQETARGRADLLAGVAATAVSTADAQIPYSVELGQEVARLCEMAGGRVTRQ